jgi:hypothetical protein
MKRFSILILVGTIISGCNSDSSPDPVPDYRDVFEGQYVGIRTNSSWSWNGPNTSTDMADTIDVVAIGDSAILIDGTEIQINIDGEFFEQGNGGASSYFSVQFNQPDSLRTDLNGGGLGGGYHSTFKGRKG